MAGVRDQVQLRTEVLKVEPDPDYPGGVFNVPPPPQQRAPAVGHRHVLALLLFLGVLHIYTLRMNMSVACETLKDLYGWSNDEKGLVLSSFYMGYMPGMLPAGMIARQHGKAVFGTAIVGCAVCSLLVPFVAAADIPGLCLLRAVTGIFQC